MSLEKLSLAKFANSELVNKNITIGGYTEKSAGGHENWGVIQFSYSSDTKTFNDDTCEWESTEYHVTPASDPADPGRT